MKKMKRLLALVLAGMLALAMFTACGTVPDDAETAAEMKEVFTSYLKEALPEVSVGNDPALQETLAAQTQQHWSTKSDVFEVKTEEGTAIVCVMGTYSKEHLPAIKTEPAKQKSVELFKKSATEGAELYKTSVTKAEVYTAARGNDVIVSYIMLFPKTAA